MLEHISYMKGLAEGLDIDYTTKEGKLLKEIMHVLEDVSYEIKQLQSVSDELEDYVIAIDEDLQTLELDYYENDMENLDELDDIVDDYDYDDQPIFLEEDLDHITYEDEHF